MAEYHALRPTNKKQWKALCRDYNRTEIRDLLHVSWEVVDKYCYRFGCEPGIRCQSCREVKKRKKYVSASARICKSCSKKTAKQRQEERKGTQYHTLRAGDQLMPDTKYAKYVKKRMSPLQGIHHPWVYLWEAENCA